MLEKFLHSVLHFILVERGEISSYWLLLNALLIFALSLPFRVMMCAVICTDGPMSFETTTSSFLQESKKGTFKNSADIDFSSIKISYLKKKKKVILPQIKKQLQNNNEKASVWSNEWKRDQNFFNEDHFISLTAKKSNTVNRTPNICVEHLFVLLKKSFVICIWHITVFYSHLSMLHGKMYQTNSIFSLFF